MPLRKIAAALPLLCAFPLVTARKLLRIHRHKVRRGKAPQAEEKSFAAPEIDAVVKKLRAAHRFAETEISPDGTHVAWVETLTGKDGAPNGNVAV
jgi:hypothetical protein